VRIAAAAYQGRMKEAASVLDLWTARMDAVSRRPNTGEGIANLAINEAIVGLIDTAKQRMDAAIEDERVGEGQLVERLVIAAIDRDAAEAREILSATIQEQRRSNTDGDAAERAMRALMSIAEGKPEAAPPLLEPLAFESRNYELVLVWSMANVLSARWEPALKGLNFLIAERSQRGFNAMKPYGMAMLGRAYAELGRTADARKAYQAFFDLWKDADPDVPLLVKAREEFAKLGS
jgi:hypothetical protein